VKLDEFKACMERVAVALGHRKDTFTIDSRPFGGGWAVFIEGYFDVAWLEKSARGAVEETALEAVWGEVHRELRRRLNDIERELTDARDSVARKEMALSVAECAYHAAMPQ